MDFRSYLYIAPEQVRFITVEDNYLVILVRKYSINVCVTRGIRGKGDLQRCYTPPRANCYNTAHNLLGILVRKNILCFFPIVTPVVPIEGTEV